MGSSKNTHSAGLMLLAVLCYSFMPLAVELSGSKEHPFLFNMGWRGGIAIMYGLFLSARFSRLFFNWTVWKLIINRVFSFDILLVMVAYFNIALFAMSIRHLDVSAAIMLAAISPVVMIFATRFAPLDNADNYAAAQGGQTTEKDITWSRLFFISLGLAGAAFIIFGQLALESPGTSSSSDDTTTWLLILSILLAVGSAIIYGLNRRALKWGAGLRSVLPDNIVEGSGYSPVSVDLFCSTAAGFIATLAVVPLCWLIGISSGESIYANETIPIHEIIPVNVLILIVIAGALTYPVAGIAWRQANIIARNPGINAFEQIRPVFSLLWLLPFSLIETQGYLAEIGIHIQADYLIIGVVVIIIANLLINFEAEIRWGFKALMIALGACGTFVYFRQSIFESLEIGNESWVAHHYFEVVGLSATIFTLLLAFRVANLVSRSHAEESQTFSLFRKLEMFAKRGVIDPAVLECVIRIDAPRNQADLKEAYSQARGYFTSAVDLDDVEERLVLNEAEAELDAMARSKQLGLVLGELFALIIFAGITIFFALLSRPGTEHPFSEFLVDVFAMLISAVIIFLTINVWDLHHERGVRQLERQYEQGNQDDQGDMVVVGETRHQLSDRWLSIIVGIAIVFTYAGLLGNKYLGWFG